MGGDSIPMVCICEHSIPHTPILGWKSKLVQLTEKFCLNKGGEEALVCCEQMHINKIRLRYARAKETVNTVTWSCLGLRTSNETSCKDPQLGFSYKPEMLRPERRGSGLGPEANQRLLWDQKPSSLETAQCPLMTPEPCDSTVKETFLSPLFSSRSEEKEESDC